MNPLGNGAFSMRQFQNPIAADLDGPGVLPILPDDIGAGLDTHSTRGDPKPVDVTDAPIQILPFYISGNAGEAGATPNLRTSIQLPFVAKSVILNNQTGQWFWLPFLDTWLPPYIVHEVINLPHGSTGGEVIPDTPVGQTSNYQTGQVFNLTFFDVLQAPKDGIAVNALGQSLDSPKLLLAVTNAAQNVKFSAGFLGFLEASNPANTDAYLHIFNVPAASVVMGTTVPVLSLFVPVGPGGGATRGAMDKTFSRLLNLGGSGISVAATQLPGADNTALSAALTAVNVGFE